MGSHWLFPACGVVVYLLTVLGLSQWMKTREAFQLPALTIAHNLFLSLGSLVMFVGTCIELRHRYTNSGSMMWFFCEYPQTQPHGPLFFWSYMYYMSKYYEMLDTVLVLLQKSKVPHFGLQVYHHAAVAPMAWLWCQTQQSLQWGGLLFNTFVHIIMYQYYAWRVLKWPTPWKRWITRLQIIQFVTSFVLACTTVRYILQGDSCAGMSAFAYNCVFNATLLFQFVGVDKRNHAVNCVSSKGTKKE